MAYDADEGRYSKMDYRSCGKSGLKLPAMSLGLWHNFGGTRDYPSGLEILSHAFDNGITHFDLANNYGPPPGAAEAFLGDLLRRDFRPYRDEMIISSKAGWDMWPGPYGERGSRKHVIASADQSLGRLGLEYFDIFYSHRYDVQTPLEETMGALAQLHSQGKALYVGISSYPAVQTREAHALLKQMGVPCTIHQPSYSILNRWIEDDKTLDVCSELGIGVIAFSPLQQGILSGKYSHMSGNLSGTRAAEERFLSEKDLKSGLLGAVDSLSTIATERGQSLSQLALAWVLRRKEITSTLIGVRTLDQLKECLGALQNTTFTSEEITRIDDAVSGELIDQSPRF